MNCKIPESVPYRKVAGTCYGTKDAEEVETCRVNNE
jgi:hypothetical protein